MKLLEFESYEQYVLVQRRAANRRGGAAYFTDLEFSKICDWMSSQTTPLTGEGRDIKGICHGARNGLEADEFKKNIRGVDVFGTDLFPCGKHKGESDVIEWDFAEQKLEWVGAFDFVYSNSLDHARDPVAVLNTWIEQLQPDGFLFLTWCSGHIEASGGDCFGASLYEYITLANDVGRLKALIYSNCPREKHNALRKRGLEVVVLVIGHSEESE